MYRSFIIIAFVKERFHNVVEIDILGIFEGYSSLQIWLPKKFFRGEIIQGKWRTFPSSTCFVPNRSWVSRFALRLGLLPCRVWPSLRVWCAFSGLCFLVYLCSRTRSPMLSDVNRGNSCIWLHLLTKFKSQQKRSVVSGRILFGIDGRVLWVHDP